MPVTPFAIHPLISGMRPVIVGEANPYSDDPRNALYPWPPRSAGGRLPGILGLSRRAYLQAFDRVNLCGEHWSARIARASADAILAACPETVVMCGAKVGAAFGVPYRVPSATLRLRGSGRSVTLLLIPHPSGLSRAWNDRSMPERVRAMLCEHGVLT